MSVRLVIRPREAMSWARFCEIAPHNSIALDGVVVDGPQWSENTLRANSLIHTCASPPSRSSRQYGSALARQQIRTIIEHHMMKRRRSC